MTPLAKQHQVSLDVRPCGECSVNADRQRLSQILLNLLSNGVKYNRPCGRVFVEIDTPAEGRVRIKVRDTGAGIP